MQLKFRILLFYVFVFIPVGRTVFAQSSEITWKQNQQINTKIFTQEQGLPVVSLTDLVLGADNHIYIASSGGVSRFNGSHFEEISTEVFPELYSNRFLYLHATPDSAVWMVDEQYFFSRWKNGSLFTFDSLYTNEAKSDWMLRTSASGSVWISNGEDFLMYNDRTGFERRDISLSDSLYDFLPISENLVLVLTNSGLYQFKENQLFLKVPISEIPFDLEAQEIIYRRTKLKELSGNRIVVYDYGAIGVYNFGEDTYRKYEYSSEILGTPASILEVSPSLLLLHSLDGHFNLDLETGIFSLFPGTANHEIWEMNYTPFWNERRIYISESAVFYGDQKIFQTQNEERISQAIQDKEGNLWLSVAGSGLVQINLNKFNILNVETGLKSNNTYTVLRDSENNMWLASYEFGIHKIEGEEVVYWSPENGGLPNNLIRSLFEKKDGTILAATWDAGIYQYNDEFWEPFLVNNTSLHQAESFFEDKNGNFWIGSRLGLYNKKPGSETFTEVTNPDGSPVLRTQVIQKDNRETLWLGTHGQGLLTYKEGLVNKIIFKDVEIQPKIRDLYFSADDTLWLATENSGLIRAILDRYNQITSYTSITKADNLPDIGVHRILTDDFGFFWLTSNQGISRVEVKNLNNYMDGIQSTVWIETFTEDDGLPIRETNGGTFSNGMVDKDGSMFIPTQKGVVHLNPKDFVNRNPFKHTGIFVASIRSGDIFHNLTGKNSFIIPTGERSVTVEFDLVHYTNPQDVILEYRIKSLSENWNPLSIDRQLSISNIPPGIHTIEMRIAEIPEKLHSGNTFVLTVPYYFYEERWFIILILGGILALIALLFIQKNRAALAREQVLNDRVKERTQLLNQQKAETEKALKTIQKQAEELEQLNEVKTNFFINMTHELRTPLTLIKGPLTLLKDASRRNDIDQEEQLGLIERNSIHLNDVVDQLLDLLRLETDRSSLNTKKINLTEFVRIHASQFQSSEELTGKTFNFSSENDDLFIVAEPGSLTLIVNNLISNAIKYTNRNDRIVIGVYPENNHLVLEVSDTGIGISEEDKQFIFDPFYRSDNVIHKKGSGIGLGIVKNFIDRFGGGIEIESELGQGTTIKINFPKPESELLNSVEAYVVKSTKTFSTERKQAESPVHSTARKKESGKPHILLVEDNEDLQLFMNRLLETDYDIHTSGNGIEAIDYLKENTPDLIITDVMMPRMDGITFIQKMRSDGNLKFIPAVILSAKKTEASITEGLLSGAQVYLTKPLDNNILLAQVESLLEREKRLENFSGNPNHKSELQIRIDELILRHISDPNLSVQAIAETLHMSRPTLYRKWKAAADDTLNEYITKTRLEEAIKLIRKKDYTFAEASIVCGFSEPSYFSRVFKKYYQMPPSAYFSQSG